MNEWLEVDNVLIRLADIVIVEQHPENSLYTLVIMRGDTPNVTLPSPVEVVIAAIRAAQKGEG